ncbi:YqzK family protein [Bacillus safensis]|uniref:YqzK family protein n=1 Tax=Bacillus safensis TaxID=561879 RepID=UPI00227EC814|nr:YqzK family protein [Bacillus safensis]MCY7734744.1 YqzK family protein [Bacillus safensis]MEC1114534.1 YqzK family protein [Bacillus safensis]
MRKWLKTTGEVIKVFILFTGFTVLFYYAMIWINSEYGSYHRYDKPEGAAIKVMEMDQPNQDNWQDRLIYFYQNGE